MPVSRPRAMVYRGPAALVGCSEAVADMLVASPRNFEVIYAGHNEAVNVSAENLSKVDLYVQPGGAGTLCSHFRNDTVGLMFQILRMPGV